MTRSIQAAALLALGIVLSGCKLAVIVVEGGEVQSTGSGTCSAGTVCITHVNDTSFTETYTAVPSPGWEFVRWSSGTGFVCATSPGTDCTISNVDLAGIEAVEALVASGATFFIMPVFEEIEVGGPRPEYDPDRTDYNGGVDSSMLDRLYWSTDGAPPDVNGNRWFEGSVNRCVSSQNSLGTAGFYISASVRRWQNSTEEELCIDTCSDGTPINNSTDYFSCQLRGETVIEECSTEFVPGRWRELSGNIHSPDHVECEEDVIYDQPGNGPGQADGFPRDNVPDADAFSALTAGESDVDWTNGAVTLYHANYLDYLNDPSP